MIFISVNIYDALSSLVWSSLFVLIMNMLFLDLIMIFLLLFRRLLFYILSVRSLDVLIEPIQPRDLSLVFQAMLYVHNIVHIYSTQLQLTTSIFFFTILSIRHSLGFPLEICLCDKYPKIPDN